MKVGIKLMFLLGGIFAGFTLSAGRRYLNNPNDYRMITKGPFEGTIINPGVEADDVSELERYGDVVKEYLEKEGPLEGKVVLGKAVAGKEMLAKDNLHCCVHISWLRDLKPKEKNDLLKQFDHTPCDAFKE